MRRALRLTPALGLLLGLAFTSIALAVSLKKGATYAGKVAKAPGLPLSLKVSSSGKTVTASMFTIPAFCEGGGAGTKQITKPASISKSGSFVAKISYEFVPEHKIIEKLTLSGKFSGKKASGKATSEFLVAKQCNGATTFTAKAK